MKVLVIDDDPTILDLVVQFLDLSTHHDVDAAPSAKAALEAIGDAQEPFDCFLCDIQMPEVDGISLVQLIRQTPGHQNTPIIMLTAMQQKQNLDRAFGAGATDYITKPFDCSDLPLRLQAAQKLALAKARQVNQPLKAGEFKGMGGDLKEIRLNDSIALPRIDSAIDYSEFENYLRQLMRRRTSQFSTVAVKIGAVDRIHAAYTSGQFKELVGVVAAAVQDTLLIEGGVLSYRGSGTFLCIPEKCSKFRRGNQETELNERYRSLAPSSGQIPVQLLVGDQVLLGKGSEAKALDALTLAIESVEARSVSLGDILEEPRRFLKSRRLAEEQQHLEKRAYEALLNDSIAETGHDAWVQRLLRRQKAVG